MRDCVVQGGWGIPRQGRFVDEDSLASALPSRASMAMKRPGLPIWNSVGQQLSTGVQNLTMLHTYSPALNIHLDAHILLPNQE